ncbi:recombinase family protein [Jannaschia marina]|uniref:recombinase family protein n=1 Tax=Jannaschia marina TaxID=2741674 RepID=UPI0038B39C9C
MVSSFISSKISANQVIAYRRVSSKSQEASGYQSQLRSIKHKYPNFSLARSTIGDIKEVISGRVDPEVRFCRGLGKALKLLIRHPHAIILVSNLDRIGRCTEVFELIQAQGVGHRILDAETGKSLDDLMAAKQHIEVAKRTKDQQRARRDGLERYRASGGVHGSTRIKQHSHQGAKKKKALAKERLDAVLEVITVMVRRSRGRRPKLAEVADELDRHDIRTGQGRLFDAERLSQLRKSHPGAFKKAFNRYKADRQRIRAHVRTTSLVNVKRRQSHCLIRMLAPRPRPWTFRTTVGHCAIYGDPGTALVRKRRFDRCRSPPPSPARVGDAATCHW